jgi:outer membrane lipoprotein-sorting protein
MQNRYRWVALVMSALALSSTAAAAQTADEIVEKHLAATGGRAALSKLTSRRALGTLTLTTPVGDLSGPIEVYSKAPNKSRTFIKLDLTAVGGGEVVNDQRFDGAVGYIVDTFNGNREMTGDQLEAMKNGFFPSAFLVYKEQGIQMALAGREKIGDAEAYVLTMTPKSGPAFRMLIDAATLMLVRTVMTLNIPQLGGDVEQVVDFSDFRDVDGIKVPFTTRATNPAQAVTARLTSVTHNVDIPDGDFVRPSQ